MNTQAPVYGLWNGSAWMRTRNGLPVTSHTPAFLAAHLHNWKLSHPENKYQWQIWPISETGLPMREAEVSIK